MLAKTFTTSYGAQLAVYVTISDAPVVPIELRLLLEDGDGYTQSACQYPNTVQGFAVAKAAVDAITQAQAEVLVYDEAALGQAFPMSSL